MLLSVDLSDVMTISRYATGSPSTGCDPALYDGFRLVVGGDHNTISMVSSNSGVTLIMEKVLNNYKHSDVIAVHLDQTIESRVILAYPNQPVPFGIL